jgi:hypothetical protein
MKRRLTPAEGARLRAELVAELQQAKADMIAMVHREVDEFVYQRRRVSSKPR